MAYDPAVDTNRSFNRQVFNSFSEVQPITQAVQAQMLIRGTRVVIHNGEVWRNKYDKVANKYVKYTFMHMAPSYDSAVEGVITVTGFNQHEVLSSLIQNQELEPQLTLHIDDLPLARYATGEKMRYLDRQARLEEVKDKANQRIIDRLGFTNAKCEVHRSSRIENERELREYLYNAATFTETRGVLTRSLTGIYKNGPVNRGRKSIHTGIYHFANMKVKAILA